MDLSNLRLSQKSNELKTEQINYGVNRFDVFGSFSVDFVESMKTGLENKLGKVVQVKFEEYIGVVSIAHEKSIDNKQLLDLIDEFFKDNQEEYRKIYNFNTGIYFEDFIKGNRQKANTTEKSLNDNRYKYTNFENQWDNDRLFSFVGLDKEAITKHFNSFIDSKLNIGVL